MRIVVVPSTPSQERLSLFESSVSSADLRDLYAALDLRDDRMKQRDAEIKELKAEIQRLQQTAPRYVAVSPASSSVASRPPRVHPPAPVAAPRRRPPAGEARQRSLSRRDVPVVPQIKPVLSTIASTASSRSKMRMSMTRPVLSPSNRGDAVW